MPPLCFSPAYPSRNRPTHPEKGDFGVMGNIMCAHHGFGYESQTAHSAFRYYDSAEKLKPLRVEPRTRMFILLDFLMADELQRSLVSTETYLSTKASAVQIKGSGLHAAAICSGCRVCGLTPVWSEIRVRKGELGFDSAPDVSR